MNIWVIKVLWHSYPYFCPPMPRSFFKWCNDHLSEYYFTWSVFTWNRVILVGTCCFMRGWVVHITLLTCVNKIVEVQKIKCVFCFRWWDFFYCGSVFRIYNCDERENYVNIKWSKWCQITSDPDSWGVLKQ